MAATVIEWDGEPFALLIETGDGRRYLVPPIVLDEDGNPTFESREILEAVVQSGATIQHRVIHGATPADLAEIDQHMQQISDDLGVPIGPDTSDD